MKQQLISTGLALADFIHRHPRRIAAAIATLLLGGGGGAFAVASLAPAVPEMPVHLVTESIAAPDLPAQAVQLQAHAFTLYRSDKTRAADTPEALLQRLGLADPAAAEFLRRDATARQALFGRGSAGRTVVAEATDGQALQTLRMHWVPAEAEAGKARTAAAASGQGKAVVAKVAGKKAGGKKTAAKKSGAKAVASAPAKAVSAPEADAQLATSTGSFKRLVIERVGEGFQTRLETAPLVATQRLASGVIRSTLYAATDEADLPDSVTRQMTRIFESNIDFHRGLHKGDSFAVVYETLEADGEPVRTGRVLSAEFVNRSQTHQALWYQESPAGKGAYFSFDGQSLRRAYLAAPLEATRISSGFGMRTHPVYGYSREHTGVDYAAPTGTPVRTVGDGTVEFAGVQNGYGNVIYIRHRNKKDSTVYAHLSRIDVKAGQNVSQGDTIGAVGSTGVSTGPHLHFEFRVDNQPQDPTIALAQHRESLTVSPAAKQAFAAYAEEMKMQLAAAGEMTGVGFE